jgi:hypothetical protein
MFTDVEGCAFDSNGKIPTTPKMAMKIARRRKVCAVFERFISIPFTAIRGGRAQRNARPISQRGDYSIMGSH